MQRSPFINLLTVLLFPAGHAFAQTPEQPHQRTKPADMLELAGIMERGKTLAAYDAAAWYGSDAVQALHPPDERIGMYIGRKTDNGWVMGFGQLNAAGDKFLLWYEAIPTSDVKHPTVTVHEPAIADQGSWLYAARAFTLLKAELTSHGRPYNLAVIPAADHRLFVYAYPAQTDLSVFPYGADTRCTVSADGSKIEEIHKMHTSLLEYKGPPKGGTIDSTYRTAFLDDAPEDSDVAYVIMMGHIPMLIVGKTFVYRVEGDGSAKYVAPTKEFLKNGK